MGENENKFLGTEPVGVLMRKYAVPCIISLLPQKYGLDGVLYSMPLSDLLTFLIAVILIIRTYRELEESGYRKEMAGWTTN